MLTKPLTAATLLGAALSLATAQPQAAPNAGRNFMKGGTFCFTLKQPALPQWRETFKLVVQPTSKGKTQHFPILTGLQHGLLTGAAPFEYISQQSGSASYDLSGQQISLSLSSNEAGYDLDNIHPGVWVAHIAMTLSGDRLVGKAIGTKRFTPVYDGKVWPPFDEPVDGQVTPIPCAEF
jgi:hypothetical protein